MSYDSIFSSRPIGLYITALPISVLSISFRIISRSPAFPLLFLKKFPHLIALFSFFSVTRLRLMIAEYHKSVRFCLVLVYLQWNHAEKTYRVLTMSKTFDRKQIFDIDLHSRVENSKIMIEK